MVPSGYLTVCHGKLSIYRYCFMLHGKNIDPVGLSPNVAVCAEFRRRAVPHNYPKYLGLMYYGDMDNTM